MKTKILLILTLVLTPFAAHAKTIETAYFMIDLPERFVHSEEGSDFNEGRIVTATEGYNPWGNAIVAGGSMIMTEYGKSDSKINRATTKKEFIKRAYSHFEDVIDNQTQMEKIEKPFICEDNAYITAVCMNSSYKDDESKIPMNMFSYFILLKSQSAGVFMTYVDSNDEETGRKAAREIYEQIKRSNAKISEKNRYNP